MPTTRFRNFMAASRKPNMHAFGLFPEVDDLKWIECYIPGPTFLQSGTGITGTIDGTNAIFILSEYSDTIALFVNGVLQIEDVDYTYTSGTGTIVFTAGSVPMYGAYLSAMVWSQFDATTSYGAPPKIEVPSGTRDGVNAAFTLAATPTTCLVYYNGQLLSENTGYTRATNVLTMLSPNVPGSATDLLVAVYW